MTDNHRYYLGDLGFELRELAFEAKRQRDEAQRGTPDYDFHAGRLLGFHEVVSLMQHYARTFDIPLEELRLEGIDPERDLI